VFQPVRGTHDLLPEDMRRTQWLLNVVRQWVTLYGFEEMATPIFEFSGVFHRLGESSDVVAKETYTFHDRGGEELTLRPEGTAGVVRAVISNGLTQQLPLKFFYTGPMFRYDRPQKGRYRQFDQIGLELLGVATPIGDIEVIALAVDILKALGVYHQVILELNTLGDYESRQRYRSALITYFEKHERYLSIDSQRRLRQNPLRILDSKDRKDRELIAAAPQFDAYLTDGSKAYFQAVCEGLDFLGISFVHNPFLVRGLDYYCHTAFEFVSTQLGAQGTVLAGGRYDHLVEQLGGPSIPAVGWAGGIERLLLLAQIDIPKPASIMMIPLDHEREKVAFQIAQELRKAGRVVEMTYSGSLAKRLKRADRIGADWAILLGEDEIRSGQATVRHLRTSQQEKVAISALPQYFKSS
jgi:histidyl-tRNA synthetase